MTVSTFVGSTIAVCIEPDSLASAFAWVAPALAQRTIAAIAAPAPGGVFLVERQIRRFGNLSKPIALAADRIV
jgi:hypothetical protein